MRVNLTFTVAGVLLLVLNLLVSVYLCVYCMVLATLKLPLMTAVVGEMFAGFVVTALFVFDVACWTPDRSRRRRRRRRRRR